MTELEALTAAYMAACKDRPADWNEIGYWYARQTWDAAIKFEREACAKAAEALASNDWDRTESPDGAFNQGVDAAAEAIRARGRPPATA